MGHNSPKTSFPFAFEAPPIENADYSSSPKDLAVTIQNVRGRIPSLQASKLRTMLKESQHDPSKIIATCCSYDGLTSRLCEEAGFPMVFLSGYNVASSQGLPDSGYIAMEDMCRKIQEVARQVSVPIFVDGDTGYGSPMNVKRTVECFALAGASGIMIEDQTWPKRCGHTKGKSVVERAEAFARIRAAVDARNNGYDILILARTDALIHGWEEVEVRVREFMRIGVDFIFIEAMPDRDTMHRAVKAFDIPLMANIIEGGKTENLSAAQLAALGFAMVAYPITLVASHLKSVRKSLNDLKASLTVGAPPLIMSFEEVCEGVGFNKYWDEEIKYEH